MRPFHPASLAAAIFRRCSRPHYAFMLLTLVADVARPDGSAGPVVRVEDGLV